MDDLVAFLKTRIAEDEHLARQAARAVSAGSVPGAIIEEGAWDGGHEWCAKPWLFDNARVEVDLGEWGAREIAETRAAYHIARHDPARVLAEVEAKRRILNDHTTPHTVGEDGFCVEEGGPCTHAGESECPWHVLSPCATVRALALPYRSHPDYRAEWAPEEE